VQERADHSRAGLDVMVDGVNGATGNDAHLDVLVCCTCRLAIVHTYLHHGIFVICNRMIRHKVWTIDDHVRFVHFYLPFPRFLIINCAIIKVFYLFDQPCKARFHSVMHVRVVRECCDWLAGL